MKCRKKKGKIETTIIRQIEDVAGKMNVALSLLDVVLRLLTNQSCIIDQKQWRPCLLKGLSHEIDFKNFDKNLQNLAYLRDAAGF